MGLGKTLGIILTQKIKCDNCGAVLKDGTVNNRPRNRADGRYTTVNFAGEIVPINNYGNGIGVFSAIKYGAKERVLCNFCMANEQYAEQLKIQEEQEKKERQELVSTISAELSKANAEQAQQAALLQENLRLQNELLKQQLNNATMSNVQSNVATPNAKMPNTVMPNANRMPTQIGNNIPNVKRANNFCSKCGNALKPNARFCTKCGAKFN